MWLGMPIGPTTACRNVPTRQFCCISRVVLPTAWITRVIVPFAGSKSASVSGMRSPCSCSMTITNWPAFAAFAIIGWRISSMYVTSE